MKPYQSITLKTFSEIVLSGRGVITLKLAKKKNIARIIKLIYDR